MASALAYKKNFKPSAALELFYTGGPVVLTRDGSFAACACGDDVKIVDVESGKVVSTLKGDTELVTALCFSLDGKSLLSTSRSLQIRLWEIASAACLRSWKAHDAPVASMALDSSGGLLATAGADKNVFVWDVDGGFCTHAFRGHKGVVTSVTFHPDPKRLLLFSGSDDGTVRVWDLVKKACIHVLDKHFSAVTGLAVSGDGSSLLSAGRDKVVNIWSLKSFSLKTTIPVYETLEAVCIVPDGCKLPGSKINGGSGIRFLTVGELGAIRIWNSENGQCLYNQKSQVTKSDNDKEENKGGITHATVTAGDRIMCVTSDQCLLFFEPAPGEDDQVDLRLSKRLIGYNEEIIDLKYIGTDRTRLAVATNLERIRIYDLESMACLQELAGHTDIVLCLDTCVTNSGQSLLVSSAKDNTARLWDLERGTCRGVAAGHMAAVGAVAFSKKKMNFFVTGSSDRTIKVWFFEDITSESGEPAKLTSRAVVAAHDKDINALAIAPNDSLVCSASQDRTAKVWKLPELTPVITLKGHKRGVWCAEFSPVDQCVMTGSGDKTIRIWSLADGSCLKTFEGHTASVLKTSFITRGTQIISAGADGLVKLWTIKNNDCTNTFDTHEDKIWALAVADDGSKLATGGADSMVNLWTDCTAADEEEAYKQEEEEALKDQELANALRETNYTKAVQLAFELKRPYRLLNVFEEIYRKDDSTNKMQTLLQALGKEHFRLLLEYIRDWNSKAKFCHVAQRVLYSVLHVVSPTDLIKVPGIREVLEGINPYSQRHFSRIDRLSRSTFLLDFILSSMTSLLPAEDQRLLTIEPVIVAPATPPRSTSAEPAVDLSKRGEKMLEEVDAQLDLISKMKEHVSSRKRDTAEVSDALQSELEEPKKKKKRKQNR
ncbi:hypothetical protein R1sor_021345 [Riccia sorocarpa]|uniref:U3 small nucleolar RNA-associated protein 13 C-terminal domain-containing protein n=1 Tax=Riccia sorocarpa TaxID=122646 RepID=A0ABD3GIZ0_9MARC